MKKEVWTRELLESEVKAMPFGTLDQVPASIIRDILQELSDERVYSDAEHKSAEASNLQVSEERERCIKAAVELQGPMGSPSRAPHLFEKLLRERLVEDQRCDCGHALSLHGRNWGACTNNLTDGFSKVCPCTRFTEKRVGE